MKKWILLSLLTLVVIVTGSCASKNATTTSQSTNSPPNELSEQRTLARGPAVRSGEHSLTEQEISRATSLFSKRCASCHGADRGGAMGPPLLPEQRTLALGTERLQHVIEKGTPNGMPAWGPSILSPKEIELLARFLQQPPAEEVTAKSSDSSGQTCCHHMPETSVFEKPPTPRGRVSSCF